MSKYFNLPPITYLQHPLKFLGGLAVIIIVSLILGLVVPGIVAHYEGVFYASGVKSKLPSDALKQVETYEKRQKQLEEKVAQIDAILLNPSVSPEQLQNLDKLLALRDQFQKELNSAKSPVVISAFYFNRLMLFWPVFYACLSVLIFLIPPQGSRGEPIIKQFKDSLPLFIVITIMYRWPTWARNLFFYKEGRVVYAFTNLDIGPVDFFTQEIQSLIIAMLIALLWRQWASFFELRRQELRKEVDSSKATILDEAFDQTKLQRLSATFLDWQICSIFLGLAFIFYPILFWDYVVRLGDQRYTVLAIVVHTLWAISWVFISLPLFITWYAWHSVRVRAISSLAREPLPTNVDRDTAFKALSELKPVGFVNFTVSGLIALFSFLLPILQALFR